MKSKKIFIICILALFPVVVMLSNCWQNNRPDPRGEAYAGAVTCISCHKNISNSYSHNAHFGTSRPVTLAGIHGSFRPGNTVFDMGFGGKILMQQRDSGLYQAGYFNGNLVGQRRMDMVIGGMKAETYLSWSDKQIFQLPLSWFNTLHSWTNSPGFVAGRINFNRPIIVRCFECHSSYINQLPPETLVDRKYEFDKKSLIYGIDCERCHGPGADHVNFHQNNPDEKKPHNIVQFKALSRGQKLDACAVCHSGNNGTFLRSAFAFIPGDTLAHFQERQGLFQDQTVAQNEVHGNQNEALAASKCFLMSNMDCTTCHSPHQQPADKAAFFTQKCINCHNTVNHNTCKMAGQLDVVTRNKCVDCHMPMQASNVISVQTAKEQKVLPYVVRAHRIAIYPDEAKRIVAMVAKLK